ncbi:hypothetical protein PspS34_17740 [Pseudomonas sp. S34]|nr:hypothetical protein PspS34_17740 [Pseudomonas sp. S34]
MMVCSGVLMGWYGADVTPGNFQENFIEMMVTIDALNGSQIPVGANLLAMAISRSTYVSIDTQQSRASSLPQVFMCLTTGLKPH